MALGLAKAISAIDCVIVTKRLKRLLKILDMSKYNSFLESHTFISSTFY